MKKVLLFSSLKKPKNIIDLVISSWIALGKDDNVLVDILVYDDHYDESSSIFISNLKEQNKIKVIDFEISIKDNYQGDHKWNSQQIDKISQIKNKAIDYALKNNYDYLFLVDADLVLNSNLLRHLISLNKDFVFEVFWTLFYGENYYKPNAWDFHSWNYHNEETILKLTEKGTYKVGGGGACSLLSKKILKTGLNFNRLESLRYSGEDRHFCTRAQALGYDTFVDTNYPCYHIFNINQVAEAKDWFIGGARPDFFKKWLNNSWRNDVIKSFTKNKNFWSRIKYFQYEIRIATIKIFRKNFN